MSDVDDIEVEEEIPSGKITLDQYVSFVLDHHLKDNTIEDKPRYGIFWRGQMMKTLSGKFAFSNVGAAKVALYNCFYWPEKLYLDRDSYPNGASPDYHGVKTQNIEGTEWHRENKKRFREMLLQHVEIKRI